MLGRIVHTAILLVLLGGCAYNSQTITANSGSTVNCTGAVEKPVDVNTRAALPVSVGAQPNSTATVNP